MWNILLVIAVVIVLICLWDMLYDSNHFTVREYSLADPRIAKDCRAVVLADLHNKQYGKDNEQLLAAIRACRPDMILVAGDMLTARPGRKLDPALHVLRELAKEYPIYYGNGNHEHRLTLYPDVYGDMGERYQKALDEIGIRPLVNAHVQLPEYGITVYGLQIDRSYYKRFIRQSMEAAYVASELGAAETADYCILLAHNPDFFEAYAAWGADLSLAGHVHGGVARVPFWGKGVIAPSLRLFPQYDGGQFTRDGHVMIVSSGMWMHTIPVRLFNPAELVVLHLQHAEPEKTKN